MNIESEANEAVAREHAYRRGFMQGYSEALDHIDHGKSKDQMNNHLNTAILDWREGDCSIRIDPPLYPK